MPNGMPLILLIKRQLLRNNTEEDNEKDEIWTKLEIVNKNNVHYLEDNFLEEI